MYSASERGEDISAKKRLIIHLGLPRTGTTSIQNFLRSNDAALEECGIWYPKIDPEPYYEANAAVDDFRTHATKRNLSKAVYHAVLGIAVQLNHREGYDLRIKNDVLTDFLDQFEQGRCHTAIISFEGFGANPKNYSFSDFRDALSRFTVHGIVYHCQIGRWMQSLFNQAVRGKVRFSSEFTDLIFYHRAKDHSFVRKVEIIKKNFLLDELIVRSFDEAAKADRLLEDFFESLDLLDERTMLSIAQVPRSNASFAPSQTLVLLQLNRWGIPDDDFVAVRKAFAQRADEARMADPYSIVPAEALERLRMLAAEEAETLQREYGISIPTAAQADAPLPHRLTRARFDEMIESIASEISPELKARLLKRSEELENGADGQSSTATASPS